MYEKAVASIFLVTPERFLPILVLHGGLDQKRGSQNVGGAG
jgi:hypothetical protein